MKTTLKKTVATLLVVVMLVGIAPMAELKGLVDAFSIKAFAATEYTSGNWNYTVTDSKATITKYLGTTTGETVTTPTLLGGYTVAEIGNYAFEESKVGTVNVSNGVVTIGGCAFRNCSYLTTVSLPSTLTRISTTRYQNEGAFNNCSRLTSVTFASGTNDLTIEHDAFRDCKALKTITIPGQCVFIGNDCFVGCSALESFTLKNNSYSSTQSIGESIFNGCSKLKTVSLPNTLKEIPNYAFCGTAITSFNVQEGVERIGQGAFRNCSYLTTVSLPSTLTRISTTRYQDEGAFNNCSRLTSVTFASGTNDLTIEHDTFRDCKALKTITIPGQCVFIGNDCFVGCSTLESFTLKNNSYSSTQSIGESIFNGCSKLKTVSLPNTLKEIPNYAFCGTAITSFNVQEGVERIGQGAFRNCSYLTTVSLPSTLTRISTTRYQDEGAFNNCSRLTSVTFASGTDDLTIEHDTFRDCKALKTITIPGQCVFIGNDCFVGCSVLESFTLKKNSYSSTQSIGESIFNGCSKLKKISLPNTLKEIPNYAFCGTAITSFNVQEGVETIGQGAFKNCSKLASVSMPSTLTRISTTRYQDEGAFNNCTALNAVVIAEGSYDLTIEHDTFRDCTSLQLAHLPTRTASIGENAFANCPSILNLCCKSSSSYVKSYATANSLNFKTCSGHSIPLSNYKVTYDANGGSVSPASATVVSGCTTTLPAPSKSFTVTYNANGGSNAPSKQTVNLTCKGWATSSSATSASYNCGASYKPTANTTLYAVWNTSASATLSNSIPTYSGKTFLGWATSSTATSAKYAAGEKITVKANTTLYAVWACSSHKYTETVVTAATTSSDGQLKRTCSVCGYVEYKTIPKVSTVKLSSTKFTYSGNPNTPVLTVKDSSGKVLTRDTDYKISGNASKTACGVYTMKITFMGKYSGTKSITWTVVPKAVKTTVKLYGYDDVQINWNKVTGAQGYRVYYKKSTDSSWKSKDVTTNSAKLSNLADGVKYQIRVRAFVKSSSGSVYTSKEDTNTPTIYTLKKISTPKVSKYASGKVKVSWTNINGESGYQISKSTSKTGTNVVSTYSTTDGSSKVLSVTKGKTYYYKVRAYKTVDGNKIYGPWSDVKSYKLS